MKLLALALIPVVIVRAFFWELVGSGILFTVGHFVVKNW